MLQLLRTRRYLTLSALMVVVAIGCVAAGTWQIYRYTYKHNANDDLRANDHKPTAPVAALLTVTDASGRDRTDTSKTASPQFRRATATGTYLTDEQLLVRERSVDGDIGYYVLTPLATGANGAGPVLLVVRGFVAGDQSTTPKVAGAPTAAVAIAGRIALAENRSDKFGADPAGEVSAINPVSAAARLHRPLYDGFLDLSSGQPGTAGLTAIPAPSLSNPAGGAVEPQHLAYVIQWYLFAALALAAPIVMARSETRRPDEPVEGDLSSFGPPDEAIDDETFGIETIGIEAIGIEAIGIETISIDSTGRASTGETLDGPAIDTAAEVAARRARLADRYGTARRI